MMIGNKQREEGGNTGLHNTLAAGASIKGNLTVEGDLRMDGKIEGDITCSGKIVVGPKSEIKGNVQCANAEIHGLVEGNIEVKEKLAHWTFPLISLLKSSSTIKGDIRLQIFEVEPGAKIEGRISSGTL